MDASRVRDCSLRCVCRWACAQARGSQHAHYPALHRPTCPSKAGTDSHVPACAQVRPRTRASGAGSRSCTAPGLPHTFLAVDRQHQPPPLQFAAGGNWFRGLMEGHSCAALVLGAQRESSQRGPGGSMRRGALLNPPHSRSTAPSGRGRLQNMPGKQRVPCGDRTPQTLHAWSLVRPSSIRRVSRPDAPSAQPAESAEDAVCEAGSGSGQVCVGVGCEGRLSLSTRANFQRSLEVWPSPADEPSVRARWRTAMPMADAASGGENVSQGMEQQAS